MRFSVTLTTFAAMLFSTSAVAQNVVWGQCGGIGYYGYKTCPSGSVCIKMNPWYSQCIPGASPTSTQPEPTPTGKCPLF